MKRVFPFRRGPLPNSGANSGRKLFCSNSKLNKDEEQFRTPNAILLKLCYILFTIYYILYIVGAEINDHMKCI